MLAGKKSQREARGVTEGEEEIGAVQKAQERPSVLIHRLYS